nr:structural protein [Tolivirales sp.]
MTKKSKKVTIKLQPKKRSQTKRVVNRNELTRLGSALRSLGGLGGGALGGLVGMPSAGAGLGTNLGAALSRWLGSGDYTVGTNSIVQRAMKGSDSIPAMHNASQSVVVRHREYIGEVRGATTFTVQDSFQINPGNDRTFPWLSKIATGFQEYRIKGMVFHYIPTSGSSVSGSNPALGSVMLSTSYRSNDVPPASKVELLNEYCSNESVPNEPFCHPIECDPKENPFNVQYVRSGEVPAEDSRLLYDLGVTHLCVSGQLATGNVIGDLWVTYEVELKKPIVASNVTERFKTALHEYNGAITGADWFNGTLYQSGNLFINASGRTITFPKGAVGSWLVVICLTATTTFSAADLSGAPVVTNCSLQLVTRGGNYIRSVLGGTTPTLGRAWYQTCIEITDPAVQATVTVPSAVLTGAATQSNIWVCQSTHF